MSTINRMPTPMRSFLVLFLLLFVASAPFSFSQQASKGAPSSSSDPLKADGESIDSILAATYDVISGPAGKKRDWVRFRALFYPEARLIPAGRRPSESDARRTVLSPDDYIERVTPFFEKEGFFERGVSNRVDRFGNIAQVFSTYESRHSPADAQPFQRGINSFQLLNDGTRWWIVNLVWQAETKELSIPAAYLSQ